MGEIALDLFQVVPTPVSPMLFDPRLGERLEGIGVGGDSLTAHPCPFMGGVDGLFDQDASVIACGSSILQADGQVVANRVDILAAIDSVSIAPQFRTRRHDMQIKPVPIRQLDELIAGFDLPDIALRDGAPVALAQL